MNSIYFNKYLKYKNRYLKYKNQIGNDLQELIGGVIPEDVVQILNDTESSDNDLLFSYMTEEVNNYKKEINSLITDLGLEDDNGIDKIYISLINRTNLSTEKLLSNKELLFETGISFDSLLSQYFNIEILKNQLQSETINSIIEYYDDKMDEFNTIIIRILLINNIQKINWFNLEIKDVNMVNLLYIIREFIVHITILVACKYTDLYAISNNKTEIKIREEPIETLKLLKEGEYLKINISGSKELLSDIDVNINANGNTTFYIKFLEDLLKKHIWFDHALWRVDFFGDTTYVEIDNIKYYIDTRYYDENTKKELFKYAIVSMFKHTMNDKYLNYIDVIKNFLYKLGLLIDIDEKTVNDIFKNAIDIMSSLSKLDIKTKDNNYCKKLLILDKLINTINRKILKIKNKTLSDRFFNSFSVLPRNNQSIEQLFNEFVITTAEANIYRDENYILLGTVLHVVRCLQTADVDKNIKYECQDKLITLNPCCTLDNFNLILSAIEQLGYILHNLFFEDEIIFKECNLVANKYFIRFIDALTKYEYNNINNIQKSIYINDLVSGLNIISTTTNTLKILKDNNSKGAITDMSCNPVINILKSIDNLLNKFNKLKNLNYHDKYPFDPKNEKVKNIGTISTKIMLEQLTNLKIIESKQSSDEDEQSEGTGSITEIGSRRFSETVLRRSSDDSDFNSVMQIPVPGTVNQ